MYLALACFPFQFCFRVNKRFPFIRSNCIPFIFFGYCLYSCKRIHHLQLVSQLMYNKLNTHLQVASQLYLHSLFFLNYVRVYRHSQLSISCSCIFLYCILKLCLCSHMGVYVLYITNCSRWKSFTVAELNCNFLQNIRGSITT